MYTSTAADIHYIGYRDKKNIHAGITKTVVEVAEPLKVAHLTKNGESVSLELTHSQFFNNKQF